ncbi:MAG: hypothetical protein WB586_04580 [Chthoniobacterales bacterium]|jgi:hypothetical protein
MTAVDGVSTGKPILIVNPSSQEDLDAFNVIATVAADNLYR